MIKKILIYVVIALIAIQIPIIVSLSTTNKAFERLEFYRRKTSGPIGGVVSIFTKKLPVVKEVVGAEFLGIKDVFAGGEESIKEAKELIRTMEALLPICIAFTLALIALLIFLVKDAPIPNIGLTFLVSGTFGLIYIGVVYYLFIINFDQMHKYITGPSRFSIATTVLPFVPKIAKSFTKQFVFYITKMVVKRNFIISIINIIIGVTLIGVRRFLIKKQ